MNPSDDALPAEAVAVLREMARDPETSSDIRSALDDLGDRGLTDEILPMPQHWRADDYQLFCADRRVRLAEFERRLDAALEARCDEHAAGGHVAELPTAARRHVAGAVRDELMWEIAEWRSMHPEAYCQE